MRLIQKPDKEITLPAFIGQEGVAFVYGIIEHHRAGNRYGVRESDLSAIRVPASLAFYRHLNGKRIDCVVVGIPELEVHRHCVDILS